MDCAAEESEIRRAVEGISGIRALTFQLGQRSLALDAPGPALELAVAAIRKAGFDPQPLAEGKPDAAPEHAADDGHDHGQDNAFGPAGYGRLGMALLLAIAAELVGYFAPDTQIWKGDRPRGGRRCHLAGRLRCLQEGPDGAAARAG